MKGFWLLAPIALAAMVMASQTDTTAKDLQQRILNVRKLDDVARVKETQDLAMAIRKVSDPEQQLSLAMLLASRATEGDFGRDTLQQVTTTLEIAVHGAPSSPIAIQAFDELAQLDKYEGMKIQDEGGEMQKALNKLYVQNLARAKVDFSLTDLTGKIWHLSDLHGKVVLVNFWATWCPPCRKEMPDLEALYKQFQGKGFVILSISDEKPEIVQPFIKKAGYTFPVLLDPGDLVNTAYGVQGIPQSFIYNRDGKLVAQSIDMRTKAQFLTLLAKANLH